jgi:SNF2 family DNA or RNA helicase
VRLLNGTPVETPLDLYSQMKILDNNFWFRHGIASWTSFQARFAVTRKIVIGGEDDRDDAQPRQKWEPIVPHGADPETIAAYEQLDLTGLVSEQAAEVAHVVRPTATVGRTIDVIVGYRDLDKLHAMIQPLSTRVTKEQAGLNLPPKLYQRLVFELAPEQRRAYDQLRREYMLELDNGALMTATLAMVRILRLQQIACGYLPNPDDPEGEPILIPGDKNPRLSQFLDWVEDIGKQPVIVWARFTHDVDLICRALGPAKCVRYDGKVGEKDRAIALDLFRGGKRQIVVAKAASMGMGLTLVNSSLAFFYSNNFSMLERLQAEDRQHRPGQHHAVTYVDLVADKTVDEKILKALREKKVTADRVVGDGFREWLSE